MQAISKAQLFRPGCMVRAFRWTQGERGSMAIARIVRYLKNDWGVPYGIVVSFEDGFQQAYSFASINIINPKKSVVTHFI